MRFKKPRGVLLGIGFGTFVVAAALFFLVPVICGAAFQYNGLNAFVDGIKGLITFNFANVLYTAIAILFVITFAVMIVFAITLISKKYKVHLITWFFTLIALFGSFVFASVFFLVDVPVNGVGGKFIESIMKVDGQMLPKILSSVVLAFVVVSNVLLIVHMFVSMVAMMVTDQISDYEAKLSAEKDAEVEAKVAEYVASIPVAAEKAPEEVKVQSSEELIAECMANDSFEERKAKEDKLFKECIDSGYFAEYEEFEFPDAIEGVEEEPVCEASEIEEKSAMVRRSSVHVGYSHE